MTLRDLEAGLPNGFHDSEIKSVFIDYESRALKIELAVWLGDMTERDAGREAYRDGELALEGIQFVSIEPPDPRYPFGKNTRLWVDLCDGPSKKDVPAVDAVPKDCFVSGFFVVDWNSFIYVAAREARLNWTGDVYDRAALLSREP